MSHGMCGCTPHDFLPSLYVRKCNLWIRSCKMNAKQPNCHSTCRQGDNFLMFILSMPNCKSSECTVHFWLTHQCLGLCQWRVLYWIFLHSWYGKNENHLPYQCMLSIPHFCCNIYTSREYVDVWDDIGIRIVREIIVITVNIVILTYENRFLDSSFKTFFFFLIHI